MQTGIDKDIFLTKSSIEELFNELSARVFDLSSMLTELLTSSEIKAVPSSNK